MQRLEVLGWWFDPAAPSLLPRPQRLVAPWPAPDRELVLRHLRAGTVLVTYPEPSFCRFDCGETAMGRTDLTDGTYVWPEGLAHYVERHDVRLPEAFVAHVRARGGVIAPFRAPKATFGLYHSAPWRQWGLEQRACPQLEGFERPDAEVCERIAADLGDVEHETILLCRGSTREVVLGKRDGSLELRQLRAGGNPPRTFATWDEWPIAGDEPAAGPARGLPMDALRQAFRKVQGGKDGDTGVSRG